MSGISDDFGVHKIKKLLEFLEGKENNLWIPFISEREEWLHLKLPFTSFIYTANKIDSESKVHVICTNDPRHLIIRKDLNQILAIGLSQLTIAIMNIRQHDEIARACNMTRRWTIESMQHWYLAILAASRRWTHWLMHCAMMYPTWPIMPLSRWSKWGMWQPRPWYKIFRNQPTMSAECGWCVLWARSGMNGQSPR